MRVLVLGLVCCFGFAHTALAQATPGCNATQAAVARTALDDAKSLTIKAAARVEEGALYERWFGT
ncbi:MAG: protease, partial [Loktanella sp.]|nr:protease [Loktanella sp.]